mgnify:CR=1 FL=1
MTLRTTDEIKESIRKHFEQKVPNKPAGACWEWTGSKVPNGYGHMNCKRPDGTRHHEYAHRLAWTIWRGVIPQTIHVLHTCDNPGCVNPDHLFLGSPHDNTRDAVNKGRFKPRIVVDRTPVSGIVHGRPSSYINYSCRCQGCLDAFIAWNAPYMAKLKANPIPEDLHGIGSIYSSRGCRCVLCRQAESNRYKKYYDPDKVRASLIRLRQKPIPAHLHGRPYTYMTLACRCDLCKKASALYQKTLRQRHKLASS